MQVVNDVNSDISFAVMSVLRKRKIKFFYALCESGYFHCKVGLSWWVR